MQGSTYAMSSSSGSTLQQQPSSNQAFHTNSPRPLRNHNRSHSAEALTSTSYVHIRPSPASTSSAISSESNATIPRPSRRTKLFGFTPASESSASSSSTATLTNRALSSPSIPLIPMDFTNATFNSNSVSGSSHAMIRKKSGELVRSSLTKGRPTSKSAPTSPSATTKFVHFNDSRLEDVKHFFFQQKPAAVSRSGSPIETETEDEQPEAFPFPAMTTSSPGLLSLRLPNFPSPVNLNQEACLEKLEMAPDGKSLRGMIRVQNISFQKWVAVRFTLDHWLTVSEVSADHHESIVGGKADRFVFSIRLQDLLAKIEEKVMFIAVRYRIEGREIWDNNGGENYRIEFTKSVALPPPIPAPITYAPLNISNSKRQTWSAQATDLRKKLNLLVADDFDPAPLSSPDYVRSRASAENDSPTPFNTRYDFGTYKRSSRPNNYSPSSSTSTTTYGSPSIARNASTLTRDDGSSPTTSVSSSDSQKHPLEIGVTASSSQRSHDGGVEEHKSPIAAARATSPLPFTQPRDFSVSQPHHYRSQSAFASSDSLSSHASSTSIDSPSSSPATTSFLNYRPAAAYNPVPYHVRLPQHHYARSPLASPSLSPATISPETASPPQAKSPELSEMCDGSTGSTRSRKTYLTAEERSRDDFSSFLNRVRSRSLLGDLIPGSTDAALHDDKLVLLPYFILTFFSRFNRRFLLSHLRFLYHFDK